MERTRLKDIRALFFVGVNEGCIPKNTESGGILTEMDRDFLGGQGIELAPGPKELMNTQRFYLYLNLTKPSERLCLSYSMSNGKGEATGPAFLIRTVQTLFPKLKTERAEEPQNELELIETPNTAVEYFLSGLTDEEKRKDNPIFAELYSWYLNSPRYCTVTKKLIEAAFIRKPVDQISKSVAKALYGEVSPNGATRLERFSACAFAHFLKYGLEVQERAEYEFKAMDMGNVIHQALEDFAAEIHRRKLKWSELSDELRDAIADECLDKISADYGNTILQSSARNQYMIERTRRILRRTVWALQEQLRNGKFQPEGFEVSIGGGRIDRLDIMKTDDKVYVKIIDYKTGNTTFDLVSIYYGLQMQLVVYMDAAVKAEQRKYPNAEVKPAGIFYYNVKDPMLQKEMEDDLDRLDPEIFKKLKMNGLVLAEDEVISGLDRTTVSLPMAYTSTGLFRKGSSIVSENEFALLDAYVKKKITDIREAILDGNAEVSPYEMGNRNACTYCPYQGTCGFDRKIPGYEFRRLKQFADDEIWKAFAKEVDDEWE
ncbi:MAG: PD-(D/E)XK nuclease family protein [Lachnospiraceae bacterium]